MDVGQTGSERGGHGRSGRLVRFRERGRGAGVFGLIVETVPVTFRDWHCVRGIGGPGAQLLERFPEQVDEAIADKQGTRFRNVCRSGSNHLRAERRRRAHPAGVPGDRGRE